MISLEHAIPAAPAPDTTIRTSLSFFFAISRPLMIAALLMIAVPCWSSWKTGMFMVRISSSSISKQVGAEMSSRLMPPKVGSRSCTVWMTSLGSCV